MKKITILILLSFLMLFSWTATSLASDSDIQTSNNRKAIEELLQSSAEEYLIKFKTGISDDTKSNKLSGLLSTEVGNNKLGIYKVSGNNNLNKTINENILKGDNDIEYIIPNYKRKIDLVPNDIYYTNQTYLSRINVPNAWDITTGSQTITVAVIDSGIDMSHPDLQGKIIGGRNFLAPGNIAANDIYDLNGHGTFVSGIIGAATNNNIGISGAGWNTKIMPLQAIWNDGTCDDATVISAIIYAVDNGAKVINMSLGGPNDSQALQNAIDYATLHNVVVVSSAGNDSSSSLIYPAACNGVIGVGSVNNSNVRSTFSNYNSSVDVVAPGENILSTFSRNAIGYAGNSGYMGGSGTSFSAPQVSALTALMLSVNPNLTYLQTTNIIESTSLDLGTFGRDDAYGYGLINAAAAVGRCIVTSADPGSDKITYKSFNVILDGSKSKGAVGKSLTFNWRFISKPMGSTTILLNSNSVTPNFTADVVGDYVIGLTVNNGSSTSEEKTVKVKVKDFNSTIDDIDMGTIGTGIKITSGYDISDMIPLTDGWVIAKSLNNEVLFLNVLTGDTGKVFKINGTPGKLEYDTETNTILAGSTDKIAKINVDTGNITYIDMTSGDYIAEMVLGNNGILFVKVLNNYSGYIRVINLVSNSIGGNKGSSYIDNFMIYDKARNNLITAGWGIIKYSFNTAAYTLTQTQNAFITGNDLDFVISNDNNHIALSSGLGNGNGYTIFDIDSSDITKRFGEWNTGAHPASADFSLDNKYIVTDNGSNVVIFDVANHNVIKKVCDSTVDYAKVRFSKGSKIVYRFVNSSVEAYQGLSIPPVKANSLSANKTSPQLPNTPITWTCEATGGTSLRYQFYIYTAATGWQLAQAYSTNNTFVWTPTVANDYTIDVWIKDVSSANDYDTQIAANYKIQTVPVTDIRLVANKTSPQSVNIPITWTCSATGGASLLYQFYVYTASTGWQLKQPYSANNTFAWTPTAGGDYQICAWVKDAASSTTSFDGVVGADFKINGPAPVVITSLISNKTSPQAVNTPITWTASASGGTSLLYQFYEYTTSTGWQLKQPYSANNTFTWTPTSAGDYQVCVWVKDASSSTSSFDTSMGQNFKINGAAPVTITSLKANKTSPQTVNTPITWTASASGGTSLLYQFYVYTASTGWQLKQAYSANSTFTWTPASAGDYQVCVWVKDVSSSTTSFDGVVGADFKINGPAPVAITSLTSNKTSPQTINTPITWTCSANGGTSLRYQFYVYTASTGWQLKQAYSANNTFVWTPTSAGDYQICAWVKDASSTSSFDTSIGGNFKINGVTPVTISGLTANKTSPQSVNTPITWTCSANGGTSLLYQFYVYTASTGWQLKQAYSANNTFVWTPASPGDYQVCAWVKDASSTTSSFDTSIGRDFKINGVTPVTISGLTANKTSPQTVNTPITWTCSASGGTSLLYQFYVYTASTGWQLKQAYSANNTFTWTPTSAGDYQVCAWVKDASSTSSFDTSIGGNFKIGN